MLSVPPLLILGAIAAWLSRYSFWTDDAVGYQFFCVPPGAPVSYEYIDSPGMILVSQANHYMEHGGRFFCHFLVQLFCGLLGKGWFATFNAIVWMCLPPLLLMISGSARPFADAKGMWRASLLVFLCFFTLPMQPPVQINYAWMGLMAMLWIYLFFNKEDRSNRQLLLLAIFSLLAGSGNESFSVPICVAIAVYSLSHKLRMSRTRWVLAVAFIIGAVITVIAPGNFRRLDAGGGESWSALRTLENSLEAWLLPALALIAATVTRHPRKAMCGVSGGGSGATFLGVTSAVNLLMCIALGFGSGMRMASCMSLTLAVLILAMLRSDPLGRFRRGGIAATAIITVTMVSLLTWMRYDAITLHNAKYSEIARLYHVSQDGRITLPDHLYVYDSRDARLMRMPWVQRERNIDPAKPDLRILPDAMRRLPLDRDTNMAVEFAPGAWVMLQSASHPARFMIRKTLLPRVLDKPVGKREADFSSSSDIFVDSTKYWRAAVYVNPRPYLKAEIEIVR